MAKKKTNQPKKKQVNAENVIGLHSEVTDQPITQTLEVNYMPYAMSVNVSRAFPEIDGFKPSHRKLLYTMYKMGLLKGERQKNANIVGQTMKLNPHGDAAIYETMVRLATGNEALLAPFVESKGNFGKYYSGDLSYAASRYTEAKLSPISAEIFKDIDKDPVDFVDSYDGAMKEPRLLPATFPNILVSANKGIGVAMASDICGFNLNEVCTATMHYLQDPDCDLLEYMPNVRVGVFVEPFPGLGVKGAARFDGVILRLEADPFVQRAGQNACLSSSDRLHVVRRPGVATEISSPLSGAQGVAISCSARARLSAGLASGSI